MDNAVDISELPELSKDQLQPTDLLLVSHDINGQQTYTSNKLQVKELSSAICEDMIQLEPDDVTIKKQNGKLFVDKVRISNVSGLGELATRTESSLKLKSMAHIAIWTGTQEQYEAIPVKDVNTLYFIS